MRETGSASEVQANYSKKYIYSSGGRNENLCSNESCYNLLFKLFSFQQQQKKRHTKK